MGRPSSDNPLTIDKAFTRRVERVQHGMAFALALCFAAVSYILLNAQAMRNAVDQARLCAAMIEPGPDGDLMVSVDRLLTRYDALIAVGLLDAQNRLDAVFPEGPTYRRAAFTAAERQPEPAVSTIVVSGISRKVCGVVMPINGDDSPASRRLVFLFRYAVSQTYWLSASLFFVVFVLGVSQLGSCWQRRWFRCRVADPLRKLAGCTLDDASAVALSSPPGKDGFGELRAVCGRLRTLAEEIATSRARLKNVERDLQTQIHNKQAGFDRRLRRALDDALIDPLTRLHNRRFLDGEWERLFAAQQARSEDLAIVMFDVDHFKLHNDTHGHAAGDEVLTFVGQLLRGTIRPTDYAVRYGGDEFLLLLPRTDDKQAGKVAERIIKLFAQFASTLSTGGYVLSMSAGIASLTGYACASGRDMLTQADRALYQAKAAGRNLVGNV